MDSGMVVRTVPDGDHRQNRLITRRTMSATNLVFELVHYTLFRLNEGSIESFVTTIFLRRPRISVFANQLVV